MEDIISKTKVKGIVNSYNDIKDSLILLNGQLQTKREELNKLSDEINNINRNRNNIKKQLTFINKCLNRVKYNTLEIQFEEIERKKLEIKPVYEKLKDEVSSLNKKVNQHLAIIAIIETKFSDKINKDDNKEVNDVKIINSVKSIEEIIQERNSKISKLRNERILTDVGLYITNIEVNSLFKQYCISHSIINDDNLYKEFLVNYGIKYDDKSNKFYLIGDNEFIYNLTNDVSIDDISLNAFYVLINNKKNSKAK